MGARYFIDTGLALHLPQTDRIRGRRQARSIHGYLGKVLTRSEALAAVVPLCTRCFPHGFADEAQEVARLEEDEPEAVRLLSEEVVRLRDGLRRIRGWDCLNPPRGDLLADLPWLAREIDALLAEDGAA